MFLGFVSLIRHLIELKEWVWVPLIYRQLVWSIGNLDFQLASETDGRSVGLSPYFLESGVISG